MTKKVANDWLTLNDVAERLGIHPSTVRLWSDKGILPTHRTSGGHRRYKLGEIQVWQETTRAQQTVLEPSSAIQSAVGQIRMQVADGRLEAEPWYQKLDDSARTQYRQSGITLVRGLLSYLSAEEGKESPHEARSIGYEYASRAQRYGLNVVDATRAYLFFRNSLLEAIISVYDQSRVPPGMAWGKMLSKMHTFTDQVLLNLIATYQAMDERKV